MPTTFPASPYFDDYNEDKQFYRILFRPGRAVQARELTQLQTLAQSQIERFGNHIFKSGSIVTDCPFGLDLKANYVKINDLDASSQDVDLTDIEEGFTLTGVTSGVSGYVITTADGVQTATNKKTIFFKYTTGNGTTLSFADGEEIQVRNASGSLVVTVVAFATTASGRGSLFTLGDGIVYINGVFLKHISQTVILSRYSTLPSAKVGITTVESTINSDDDQSLLDPALGSSNYFANGADRYKIATLLTVKELSDEDTDNFYLIFEIQEGHQSRALEKAQYSELQDSLAARTYEESGDYTVKPFSVRIREHLNTGTNGGYYYANTNPLFVGNIAGNTSKLVVGVEPGVAYVKGYRVENLITEYLQVDKGINFAAEEQQPISFNYGNYILVDQLAGPWDVDNGTQVSLRSANAQAISSNTYGATGAPGSQIGTARVKSVVYETGNIGLSSAQYRLYLYDVNLTANIPFSNVKSVYYNAGSGSDSLADIVLTSNAAILQETNFNTGLFRFPQRAMKRLRATDGSIDNSWQFKKTFDVTIAVDGSFSVTSPIANEVFPYGLGALNATQKRSDLVLVLNQGGTTANLTGDITVSNATTQVFGNVTAFTTELKPGDRIVTAGGNTYRVANITSSTLLDIEGVALGNESNVTYQKSFAIGEYVDLSETGSSGTTRSATLASDTQLNLDIEETLSSTIDAKILVNLQKTDGQEIQKTLRENRYVKIDCSSAGTTGPFGLGFSDIYRIVGIYHGTDYSESNTDVTNQFTLDKGQRDNFYTHGRITKNPSSTLTLTASSRLLVKLDYFYHDTSTGVGFFSVDSYPVDDTEATPATIKTENIPIYTSPTSGISYDLRDCIDVRPRFTDTSTDATSIGSASVNPSDPSSLSVPSGGLRVAVPNEEFNTDLEYYLARKDRVYIDKSNEFGVLRGLPSVYPNVPEEPPVGMTIAVLDVPPYPSLSPQTAKAASRQDFMTSAQLVDNRRYTMKDIGAINQRINRLEYYSALNFLEKQANDLVIPSDVTGLDRFKNGFLVDNFNGHGIGNVYDPNYKVAVDPTKSEMRPYFNIDNIDFEYDSTNSTNVLRAARDAVMTVSSVTGTFAVGQIISQSGITANIVHVVGTKLYLENTSGTFSPGSAVSTASANATVSAVTTPSDGDLVTLPYSHVHFARNPFATKPRNCVGDLLFLWAGEIELTPPIDNWTDTRTNPDLVVNFDNNLDNWLALDEAWGTQWNDWQTSWKGVSTSSAVAGAVSLNNNILTQAQQNITVNTVTERQTRSGTNLTVVPETVNYNLGNKVVDVSLVSFIRSQIVRFDASRLKPNTRVYAFFDGEPVSDYCRPIGGSFGDALTTDSNGALSGEFRIPNNDQIRFRVGQRLFRLVDDAQDRGGFVTTSATEEFQAIGITQTQETTILSSRQARVGFNTVSDRRVISTQEVSISDPVTRVQGTVNFPPVPDTGGGGNGSDPIAQTFIVEGTKYGIFVSKIDVFFRTKSSTLPITLQIREVVNGFPGSRIVPFGSVTLYPDDINVSEDASSPTPFTFPSPVYLQDGVEYCFVLLPAGNNPDYNIWVSELGENQLGTTNRVSEQPYIGVLFTSANNRAWTPVQAEDIKFTIWRADFETGTVGTAILNNDDTDYLTVSNLSGTLQAGDTVRHAGGTGTLKEYDSINTTIAVLKDTTARIRPKIIATGNITANTASNIVVGAGTIFNTEAYANAVIYSSNTSTILGRVQSITDDLTIVLKSNSVGNVTGNAFVIYDEVYNSSNANIFALVESVDDKYISLFDTNLSFLNFVPTEDTWSYKLRDSTANTVSSSYTNYLLNENTEIVSEGKIASNSTESLLFSNTKSFSTKVEFNTFVSSISPALDLFRPTSVIVHNQINNDSTNEDTNLGNALSRYISRQVTLDEGQDAEDLKVYLSGYKPSGTDIKVYVKVLNALDGTPFSEASYIELERVTSSIVVSDSKRTNDFKEYEYKIPASSLTGPNGEVQYTSTDGNTYTGFKYFAIKIVLLSTNTSVVPKVKDYRAIALQI